MSSIQFNSSFSSARKQNHSQPLVSVIIPTYNRANVIRRCLMSVTGQTYQNIEVIVIDDASSDNTEQIVQGLKDNRIFYVKQISNKGAAAARNVGMKMSRGEFIAFQDSDDEWYENKLEMQMALFNQESKNVGVVYSRFWKVINGGRYIFPPKAVNFKDGNIHELLLERNLVGTPSAIVRKECLEKAGYYDEQFPRLQDWEFFIRLSKHYEFKIINMPLLIAYEQKDSISKNTGSLKLAIKLLLEKHNYEFHRGCKKNIGARYYGVGHILCANGAMSDGRKYLIKSVELYPLCAKSWIYLALSFMPSRIYSALWYVKNSFRKGMQNMLKQIRPL